jgi:hypothetical protein
MGSIWPTVVDWRGTKPDHPIDEVLADPSHGGAEFLDALEQILAAVESASPNRWQGKRRDFRNLTSDVALLNLRSELAVAATLARRGRAFEFGDTKRANPDLVLADSTLGIEVSSRTPWGLHQLYDLVVEAVDGTEAAVHLRLSGYPVAIDQVGLDDLVAEIHAIAIEASSTRRGRVVQATVSARTGLGAAEPLTVQAQVMPVPTLGGGYKATFETDGGELVSLERAEQEILNVATGPQKRRQAKSMATLLLVDITRLGPSWLRPRRIWAQRLEEVVPVDSAFAGIGIYLTEVHDVGVRDVEIAWTEIGHRLPELDRRQVEKLLGSAGSR